MNHQLRLISYNLRYHNPADGANAWPQRRARVGALLRAYQPDLIGLQEALHGQLLELAEQLPAYSWVGVGRGEGKCGNEYAPIFYRTDRFHCLAHATFWLSSTPDRPGSMGWDAACQRIATWARLQDQESGVTFLLVNTHFDHRGEQAQVESARLLRHFLNTATPSLPALITGDFNCTADAPAYQQLTQPNAANWALGDAMFLSQTPHSGPLATFTTDFADPLEGKIDFIFVWPRPTSDQPSARPTFAVQRHAILAEQSNGTYPSDHLPVLVDVNVPPL
ncbi:MAG: endonuclease/exonuclease/phosphatase family protein [Caldilineaceae bacterium]|nr:endonuclease/exonuclease/phosphatase family protein [Caldilineaceae bacterium]